MPSGDQSVDGLSFVFQSPSTGENLRDALEDGFNSGISYNRLRILAATVSDHGVRRVENSLLEFCERGGEIEVYIGLSMGPNPDGIRRLKAIQSEYPGLVSLRLIENGSAVNLFHPKVYWFCSDTEHRVIMGSPNWSDLGLDKNVEAFTIVTESISESQPSEFITGVEQAFNEIRGLNESTDAWGTLYSPSEHILEQLESTGSTRSVSEQTRVEIDIEDTDGETLWPLSRTAPELVMELNKESRMSQISPPGEIWAKYFGVDPAEFKEENPNLPTFSLRNAATSELTRRDVIAHDHQGTVEIREAKYREDPEVQRAFLIFRRTGTDSFDYQLFLEGEHDEAEEIADFLESDGYTPGRSSRLTFVSRPN
ncbi:phospholipase D family protein [Haloferax denitrificans]|uniref:phospholipase D family protein n=1 Tax=Haloferax denitrificans TaxID=35745 RepID=UPI003C7028CC